jgi:hypothetical protein
MPSFCGALEGKIEQPPSGFGVGDCCCGEADGHDANRSRQHHRVMLYPWVHKTLSRCGFLMR